MRTRSAVRTSRWRLRGFTLVEVIVVVAILGLIAGMSSLAFVGLRSPPQSDRIRDRWRARAEAIQTGRSVLTGDTHAPRSADVLFLPDGRAIGSGADPLTGAPVYAPQ